MTKSGKNVRNGARKNTFVSDRRRINCCGADKKAVKVKNSFCGRCGKGVGKGVDDGIAQRQTGTSDFTSKGFAYDAVDIDSW
ncbi:hypothetical protein CEXT_584361 [Caerostris extrusa]|uniref:Uncharacterized protein n=1 Tax=Caerostris extrusa TaxID=172846 RepID=A0AAV4XFF5_CAEEX|nr:hypothetical protein CEXT_584361 [Caerostris extrusa]